MDGPDSRTDNYSIIFRALLQPQFASKRPPLSHMDITGRQNWRTGIHPSRPFAAVVAKCSFGHDGLKALRRRFRSTSKATCCPPQCVPASLSMGVQSVFTAYFVTYLVALGYELAAAGFLFSLVVAVAVPCRILWGWVGSFHVKPRL